MNKNDDLSILNLLSEQQSYKIVEYLGKSLGKKVKKAILEQKEEVAKQTYGSLLEFYGGDEQPDYVSPEDNEYAVFFANALRKFGVTGPQEFQDEATKKRFFDYVDVNWKAQSSAQFPKSNLSNVGTVDPATNTTLPSPAAQPTTPSVATMGVTNPAIDQVAPLDQSGKDPDLDLAQGLSQGNAPQGNQGCAVCQACGGTGKASVCPTCGKPADSQDDGQDPNFEIGDEDGDAQFGGDDDLDAGDSDEFEGNSDGNSDDEESNNKPQFGKNKFQSKNDDDSDEDQDQNSDDTDDDSDIDDPFDDDDDAYTDDDDSDSDQKNDDDDSDEDPDLEIGDGSDDDSKDDKKKSSNKKVPTFKDFKKIKEELELDNILDENFIVEFANVGAAKEVSFVQQELNKIKKQRNTLNNQLKKHRDSIKTSDKSPEEKNSAIKTIAQMYAKNKKHFADQATQIKGMFSNKKSVSNKPAVKKTEVRESEFGLAKKMPTFDALKKQREAAFGLTQKHTALNVPPKSNLK